MNQKAKLVSLFLFAIPCLCFAESKIVCSPPEGLRVDYFNAENSFKKPHNEFLTDTDKIRGMNPTIIFSDNRKEATFIIGNTSTAIAKTMKSNMAVIYDTNEQVTFSGVINEAPIMASYYPGMHILVYSQQSDWLPTAQGMRSAIYFSKCSSQ